MPRARTKKDAYGDSSSTPPASKPKHPCAYCRKRHPGWYNCDEKDLVHRKLYSREWELDNLALAELLDKWQHQREEAQRRSDRIR